MDRCAGDCGARDGDGSSHRSDRAIEMAMEYCGTGKIAGQLLRGVVALFGWLIPLGVWRLKFFPRPWRAAAISTSILAIILGAYSNAGGTVGRATFNIIGPLLSLSVALLIARPIADIESNSAAN